MTIAVLLLIAAAAFGVPAATSLSAGGFQDPKAESTLASRALADALGHSDTPLIFTVTHPDGAEAARAAGLDIVARADQDPNVVDIQSPWTSPAAGSLRSDDGRTGLVIVAFRGSEDDAPAQARALVENVDATVLPAHGDVEILAGGPAMVLSEITSQTLRDVLIMEAIAVPLSFLVLVWVFKGLLVAAVPVAVAGLTIAASMAVLRLISMWTDVSIFALNLTTALGLALAIDYTLLIISRFRDEIAAGAPHDEALRTTMRTAGRTVVFSALTVALSMATMVVFPMYFLKSFAYAGVATVALCALAALLVTPAAIVLLGPRVAVRAKHSAHESPHQRFWYRWTKIVTRRALPVGVAATVLLVGVGLPFAGVQWGLPDDRVLPTSASAHRVGDILRDQFPAMESTVTVVVPDIAGLAPAEFDRYAADASRVAGVSMVTGPTGIFAAGSRVADAAGAIGADADIAVFGVGSTVAVSSPASQAQLDDIRGLATPGDRPVQVTGSAQINRDTVDSITERLPTVLIAIAVVTFLLLFMLSGSVVVPLKALLLNVLSLTAAFGALVWIFQDGHLGALGTTPTGTLVVNMPVLLFCIAFGLSMDYEVFLIARIREYWLRSGRTRADNAESVALGLAHTGRVVTAAALIMSISFSALIAAQVSFMRMFGLGLTLAVLVDATLVRMVLLPALMQLMGRWNWWAPAPLARLHQRIEHRVTHS
ncbi:MMPL family transporter [Mycobacterium sp. SMC-4]|uniref:MMPL family transporter n=1 Tax=Mycobacterium sp. SMC-4 TaxID=2857059 RepID=UPI0021B3D4D1|nr:MMPL family transporter [Mycobacterium sp. SMC-4]